MNNKKAISAILLVVLYFSLSLNSFGSALKIQTFITLKINNNYIKMDVAPYIKDNRTFVPVRVVSEVLGAKVEWDAEYQTVKISYDTNTIELLLGYKEFLFNGYVYTMDTKCEINQNRVMVPIRFIVENMGCTTSWDPVTYTIQINKENLEVPKEYVNTNHYTDADLLWLARIIHVEAKGLSINGKVAIANVVLNRVKHPGFPKTIYDVIMSGSQFPPAHKAGFKELTPSNECFISAKMALEGVNNVKNCLYFNNRPFSSKSAKFYARIDGEYFYY